MKLQPYIESGVLELYALNLLAEQERQGVERMLDTYAELRAVLEEIELSLEQYAQAHAIVPKAATKNKIFEEIENLHKEKLMELVNLPLINSSSDYRNWLKIAPPIDEVTLTDGFYAQVLRSDTQLTQMLVVSAIAIPQEVHEDEIESLLILSGSCRCIIDGKAQVLGEGDFISIPLHLPHDVQLLSPKVMAIVQHVKLA